jgi:ribonuclease T1
MRTRTWGVLAALLLLAPAFALSDEVRLESLPVEAAQTVALIKAGGPFPYEQDGRTFRNRERLLPRKEAGYYREFTVETPGVRHRGARRIVAGQAGELYYTADHYRSFKRIREP